MEIYLVDAFTNERFGGNPAGVAVLAQAEPWPDEALMQSLAAELRASETAFIRRAGAESFALRYFTPTDEVALCGHATISAFTVLRQQYGLAPGAYRAQTAAGALAIALDGEAVWMDVARPQLRGTLSPDESIPLYRALGLALPDGLGQLTPAIVHVGLADLLLPVADQDALMAARPDREQLIALSTVSYTHLVHGQSGHASGGDRQGGGQALRPAGVLYHGAYGLCRGS